VQFEVEMKFPVAGFDGIVASLRELQAEFSDPREETDTYFAHPARDFAATDEAFRVRRSGGKNCVTYKGPKVDTATKTRQELELPLPPGQDYLAQFATLLEKLGFRRVADVRKRRRKAYVPWEGRRVEVSLDEVDRVGTFVELELVADEAHRADATRSLQSLAARLALTQSERRSYLSLLLQGTADKDSRDQGTEGTKRTTC
jgi:adenylate cyclase class 2